MQKNLICIDCPKGCALTVDIENGQVVKVSGNLCPKGQIYADSEIENPRRVLTAAVLAEGLELKMVPVRTDNPIPKARMPEAMSEIRKIRLRRPLRAGEVILADFLGLGVNLIATREAQEGS